MIYWAGPLFTEAERKWNAECARELRVHGHDIFLPQEEEPREKTPYYIFEHDVNGLNKCDLMVAVCDGADPDSGTSFEMGYFYAKSKPIITLRTDFRVASDEGCQFNIMLHESGTVKVYRPSYLRDASDGGIIAMLDKAIRGISGGL